MENQEFILTDRKEKRPPQRKRPKVFLLETVLLAFCCSGPALATTINFDDYVVSGPSSIAPADYYQPLGLVFNRAIPIANIAVQEPSFFSSFLAAGGTSPNALTLWSGVGFDIELTFVVPGSAVSATTNSVQMLFVDSEVSSIAGSIQAFDTFGNLLAAANGMTPTTYGRVLEVNAPDISRVRFSVDSDGADLDNLTVGPLTAQTFPVPEPSALILLGSGLLLLVKYGRITCGSDSTKHRENGEEGGATLNSSTLKLES